MGILQAGFDTSYDQSPDGTFLLAGCLCSSQAATKLSEEWKQLFESYGGCRWVDLVHSHKQFENITTGERERLIRAAVAIANHHYEFAVIVYCLNADALDLMAVAPDIDGLKSTYGLCCTFAARCMAQWLTVTGRSDTVDYVFERGDRGQGEVDRFFAAIGKSERLSTVYRYAGHGFSPKGKSVLIEVADLIAWEARKFKTDTLDKSDQPDRRRTRGSWSVLWDPGRISVREMNRLAMIDHLHLLHPIMPWEMDDNS